MVQFSTCYKTTDCKHGIQVAIIKKWVSNIRASLHAVQSAKRLVLVSRGLNTPLSLQAVHTTDCNCLLWTNANDYCSVYTFFPHIFTHTYVKITSFHLIEYSIDDCPAQSRYLNRRARKYSNYEIDFSIWFCPMLYWRRWLHQAWNSDTNFNLSPLVTHICVSKSDQHLFK